jgi:4-hydroxyphenylpyruvate dioxygenase
MPGQGDLPVVDFMGAVSATGYNGPLSLEIFNDQFRGGSPKSIAVDGRRSLISLMDQVARIEPGLTLPLQRLPDRISVHGVEFVEFAADESEAETLAGMFRALGFAEAARHRSKDVTLFRQGDINLVINTEKEGFAHSAYLAHGTCAYAIGLKVENAAATVTRAKALGAEPFEQRRGPGELPIPAIRGVGGGVIYFIDATSANVWEVEFEPIEVTAAADAGLITIDHVAQTMNYEEMLSWLLFYTSIFNLRKSPMVDVIDPAGLIRSQAIADNDGLLRLTLNGAENSRTLAGHFIAESFGSSIQHLALRTNDIFATADRLRQIGFVPLRISQNYYDDLEARFGLAPDVTERLKAGDILYDRDEAGEFFQIYVQTYGDGFFIEIVERREDYAGYGAPNAPFRIAAQKRSMSRAVEGV